MMSLVGKGEIVSWALGEKDSRQKYLLCQYQEINENNEEIKNSRVGHCKSREWPIKSSKWIDGFYCYIKTYDIATQAIE